MQLAEKVANLLLEKSAVRINLAEPFTWTSGIRSPIYCDNRILIGHPDARRVVVDGFRQLIAEQGIEFDVVGGTATAAIPWAAFLAHELDKPMVYIRPKPKDHGAGRQVEGDMPRAARVLIVEDLISTGGSSLTSAAACQREFDAKIASVLAIFSYGLNKSKTAFAEAGLQARTLSTFETLVGQLPLGDHEKSQVLAFAADPASWFDSLNR